MLREKPRFYTLPPSRDIRHPWLFVTFGKRDELKVRDYEHAIMDSNVGLFFHHRGLPEYPHGFFWLYEHYAKWLSKRFNLWVVTPDYPDDYNPGSLGDNVSRTLANIEKFMEVKGVEWLPVIQSRFMDTFSFIDSCWRVKELIGDHPRVAIGTVCKSRSLRWIVYCCKYARRVFPNAWIHAFGLTLGALPRVKKFIDSWDSMAWTFPRTPWLSPYKTKMEAREYFEAYLRRAREKLHA